MNIIAAEDHDHWSAWLEGHPEAAFGGDTAAVGVTRLADSIGIDPTALAPRYDSATVDRMEFFIPVGPYPDCRGSGQYRGLQAVEDGLTCGGTGIVDGFLSSSAALSIRQVLMGVMCRSNRSVASAADGR